MHVCVLTVELFIPFAHSLKDKRSVVKSLLAKLSKFNVSAAESAHQNTHQRAQISIAFLFFTCALADGTTDTILRCIESNCEAQIVSVSRETR